jgi:hypothetical protein
LFLKSLGPPYAYRSTSHVCDMFTSLCPVPKLLTTYHIYVSMYLTALHWIWFMYHGYIRKVTYCRIFWHYVGPFGSLLGHFTCFFTGVWPFFSGLICYHHLFGMLGFDHSYTCHPFPTRWSPYSSQCDGTMCQNWCFSFLANTVGYLSFITPNCSLSSLPFNILMTQSYPHS